MQDASLSSREADAGEDPKALSVDRSSVVDSSSRDKDWRQKNRQSSSRASTRWQQRVILTILAFAAIIFSGVIAFAPLMSWQTTCVALALDQYSLGVLSPVPYGEQDMNALSDVVAGRCSTVGERNLIRLTDFQTSSAVRSRLANYVQNMGLRRRDVLLAYVRSQSFAVGLEHDEDTARKELTLSASCMLAATDFSVAGGRPNGVVSCRQVLDVLAAGENKTTVVAIDLGDLRWDPRVGVVCNLVPTRLEGDLVSKGDSISQRNHAGSWLITSHDAFEFSAVHAGEERSLFSKAFELALQGFADDSPWGDGNGIIELDELARFVTAATLEWSQEGTGGRYAQHPVVWKVGVGRVSLADIPQGIPIIRSPVRSLVGQTGWFSGWFSGKEADDPSEPDQNAEGREGDERRGDQVAEKTSQPANQQDVNSAQKPEDSDGSETPLAGKSEPGQSSTPVSAEANGDDKKAEGDKKIGADGVAEDRDSADETSKASGDRQPPLVAQGGDSGKAGGTKSGSAEKTGSKVQGKPAPKSPAAPPLTDPWELIDAFIRPRHMGESMASLADRSPHVVQAIRNQIAAAEVSILGKDGRMMMAKRMLDAFVKAMQTLQHTHASSGKALPQSPEASSLEAAFKAGMLAKADEAWKAALPEARALIAVRNEAVEIARSVIELNGRLSGGIYPAPVDERILESCITQIYDASSAVWGYSENNGVGLEREASLFSDTELLRHKVTGLHQFVMSSIQTISGVAAISSPGHCHDILKVLGTTILPAEVRQKLRSLVKQVEASRAKLSIPAEASLRLASQHKSPRLITRQMVRQVSGIATASINLFRASVGSNGSKQVPDALAPLLADIQTAQAAVKALNDAVDKQSQPVLASRLISVGGALGQLFQRLSAISRSLALEGEASVVDSDQLAGVLRLIDPRDGGGAGNVVVRMPTSLRRYDNIALKLKVFDADEASAGMRRVTITRQGELLEANGGEVFVRFDPALLRVSQSNGTPLSPGLPVPVESLAWRGNQADLFVSPNPSVSLSAIRKMPEITVLMRSGSRESIGRISIPVHAGRDLVLAVKAHPITVVGARDEDGWTHASLAASAVGRGQIVSPDEMKVPSILLRVWPTGATHWELGLKSLAVKPRKVSVEVYSMPSESMAVGSKSAWQRLAADVLDGSGTRKPVLVADDVALAPNAEVVSLKLSPPTVKPPSSSVDGKEVGDESPPPKADANASDQSATEQKKPVSIGSELVVLVQEKQEGEEAKRYLFRLELEPIHPRDFVSARAFFDQRQGEIRVSLEPIDESGATLPEGGVVGKLQSIQSSQSSDRPDIILRKPVVRLSSGAEKDAAVAVWTGGDRGTATLALDVNDYPRAFIFSVDCSPSMNGVEQLPQNDWRSIRITAPDARRTALRAPTKTFPLSFIVDAPVDSFRKRAAGGDTLKVVLRPVSVGLSGRAEERIAWAGTGDRQVRYELPADPKRMEVKTSVSDWSIDVSGEGFANVDAFATVQLTVAGQQQSTIDKKILVFDGTAPVVDAPPAASVIIGRPLVVPIRVSDDVSDGFFIAPDRVRPGVSGLKAVEWAIDLAGSGKPEKWQPAVWLGGVRYEIRIETKELPAGVRLPLLVRATDRVGLAKPPARVWLDVSATPASPNNNLDGRVVFEGRGESGVWVVLVGPGGERRVASGKKGEFSFTNLEPGEYTLHAQGAVRNTSRHAEPVKVELAASPAPPTSVTLPLK